MASYYESNKKMRAAQVGTILPWSGNARDIPEGWLECNGQTLEAVDYPVLASIIGNTYGPTNGLNGRIYGNYILGDQFRLPQLNTRVLADYEPSYVNISSLQMGQTYASGAVGGIIITNGEVDITRTVTNPADLTSGSTNLQVTTGSGTGLVINVSSNNGGRAAINNVASVGQNFAIGDTLTIPASYFGGTDDVVLEVQWTLPSVADVLTPTAQGSTQLIAGDGTVSSPPTSANAPADLNFVLSDSANLTGQIRDFSVNPPSYFRSFYTIPRKLSKDHMPSHRHAAPSGVPGYNAADSDGQYVEGFQCPNVVTAVEGNQKQKALAPGSGGDIDKVLPGVLYVTSFEEGVTLRETFAAIYSNFNSVGAGLGVDQPVWSGPIPRPMGATWNGTANSKCNYRESTAAGILDNVKNWYGNQTADQIAQAGPPSLTYPTTLNHLGEEHTDQRSHNHYSFEVIMNAGYLRPPTIVPIDNIQISSQLTGSATNVAIQNIPGALNITVDVKTPTLSMMYLIRAF
jgi:microcystin-dependent protein